MAMNLSIRFACIAAMDAWRDAGFEVPAEDSDEVDWDTGAIVGTGIGGMDLIAKKLVPFTNEKRVRRLGSTVVEQIMVSGVSAKVGGLLALGNQVTTNSSACSTGTEAIAMGLERIRHGHAQRMLVGGAEGATPYIWAGFDAMRVLCRGFNGEPEKASRPMSASAGGFIPAAGAGAILLESLEASPNTREFVDLDLAVLVEDLLDHLRVVADEQGLALKAELETAAVRGDPEKLRQVFINVIDNAFKLAETYDIVDFRFDCPPAHSHAQAAQREIDPAAVFVIEARAEF